MAATYPKAGPRGTGRRKAAIARVRLVPGTGKVLINGRAMEEYLNFRKALQVPVLQPLVSANLQDKYNVLVRVHGGGMAGQADAIKLGVARALGEMNEPLDRLMSTSGFYTRDARVKERKKYGRKRARKRFQFSKR